MTNNLTIALIGTVIVLALVIGLIVYSTTLTSTGTIIPVKTVNCAVFFDSAATKPVSAINWGALQAGATESVSIYLENTGNTPINYTISTAAWNPAAAAAYISLSTSTLPTNNAASSIIPLTLTETISASITGITSYSYNIDINATG